MSETDFQPTDLLGRQINVGDIITYPGRQSSSMWMNHAIVREILIVDGFRGESAKLKVTSVHLETWNENVSVKKTTITSLERTTVLPIELFDPSEEWHKTLLEVREEILSSDSPVEKDEEDDDEFEQLPIG